MFTHFHNLMPRHTNGFVLAFHDIAPERVSELVDSIPYIRVVSLDELVQRTKKGQSTSGLCAITVDDGVGETVRNLARLFENRGWPGTFFLPTGYIDQSHWLGFHTWRNLMPLLPHRKIQLKSGVVDLTASAAIKNLTKQMERSWHTQRPDAYLPLIEELRDYVIREYGPAPSAISPPAPITWQEVAKLSRSDTIRFESHGVTHVAMSALTDKELKLEMHRSRDIISQHSGRLCRHLAYPFGSNLSIGKRAAEIAPHYYDSAVTMTLGHVHSANPWLLPRIPLYPQTATWFANMKVLLKCGKPIFGESLHKTEAPSRLPATNTSSTLTEGSTIPPFQ